MGLSTSRGVLCVIALEVRRAGPTCSCGVHLDEADALLGEAAGHQALPAEVLGDRIVQAVELLRRLRFLLEISCSSGRFGLHAERQFERFDAAFQRVIGAGDVQLLAVDLAAAKSSSIRWIVARRFGRWR